MFMVNTSHGYLYRITLCKYKHVWTTHWRQETMKIGIKPECPGAYSVSKTSVLTSMDCLCGALSGLVASKNAVCGVSLARSTSES